MGIRRDFNDRMRKNGKRYAMFNRDKNGIIVGFCNDSFWMSYRYNAVNIWNYPPNHYFNPAAGDFIICINKQHDDIRITNQRTFKGNMHFQQKDENGKWCYYDDIGPVDLGGMMDL